MRICWLPIFSESWENSTPFWKRKKEFPERELVLQFYFDLRHFLNMYDGLDDHYRIYTELGEDGNFRLYLFCIDPSAA